MAQIQCSREEHFPDHFFLDKVSHITRSRTYRQGHIDFLTSLVFGLYVSARLFLFLGLFIAVGQMLVGVFVTIARSDYFPIYSSDPLSKDIDIFNSDNIDLNLR